MAFYLRPPPCPAIMLALGSLNGRKGVQVRKEEVGLGGKGELLGSGPCLPGRVASIKEQRRTARAWRGTCRFCKMNNCLPMVFIFQFPEPRDTHSSVVLLTV